MKALSRMGVALALVFGLTAMTAVSAAETTVKGSLSCAKCHLKKSDKCQDVLTVTDAQGASTEYWIVKNEAAEKAGHQCSKTAPATVTGEVTEKDGKKWIAASKIEKG
jgi:Rieske Fe-S protein